MTLETHTLAGSPKPGKVQAVAILTLASGITNILWPLILYSIIGVGTIFVGCLALPLFLPPIVLGVFEIIYAAKLLPTPIKPAKPSQAIAVLEIVCILTGNIIPLAAGIVALIMYSEPEVKAYFAKFGLPPVPVPVSLRPEPVPPARPTPPAAPEPEAPQQIVEAAVPAMAEPEPPQPSVEAVVPTVAEPGLPEVTARPVLPPAVGPEKPKAVKKAPKPKPAPAKPTRTAPKAKTQKPAVAPAKPPAKPKARKSGS